MIHHDIPSPMTVSKTLARAIAITSLILASCSRYCPGHFTPEEKALIRGAKVPMRVLTVEDSLDLAVLRNISRDIPHRVLLSEDYSRLCSLMVGTVTHPSQDGVGIAGPQVGLNRRIVAVQRFDKTGEPFELYPNIRIVWASDSVALGSEGCLSVPDKRAEVLRSQEIIIEYDEVVGYGTRSGGIANEGYGQGFTGRPGKGIQHAVKTVRDTVRGFTAVIFQHETDHLEGILYTDRIEP